MTSEIEAQETVTDSVADYEEFSRIQSLTDDVYAMSPEEFVRLKVADRDVALFLLVRELSGTVRALAMKVDEYEEKAKGLATPEGISKVLNEFLGSGNMGGMGGLMGAMFR